MRTRAPLLAALGGLLLASSARADLFSPGPLAKPHADLEGLRNCTKCHVEGSTLSQEKCLSCHVELRPRVARHEGFHGRMADDKRDCQNCHQEHQGADFDLVQWTPSKKGFPHGETGWPLRGKHAKLDCESCHERRRIEAKDILAWLDEHPAQKQTYLGLSAACTACHFDEHRGQLGAKCQSCHVEKAWKPAPGFDHGTTDYPLTGKHAQVACAKCHETKSDGATPKGVFPAPVSMRFEQFGSVPHESCLDCHQDPHQGRFGDRCDKCHTTAGWLIVRNAEAQTSFHDKTRFPLRGMHREVGCRQCHGPFPGKRARFKGLAFQQCTNCHFDAHEGQLADPRTHKTACEQCHTVDGFTPARFTLADHQKTRYPLQGAHQATACNACHASKPELAARIPAATERLVRLEQRKPLFSFASFTTAKPLDRCDACHQDPHAGQFKASGGLEGKACSQCHQLTAFTDLLFDHSRDSRFPLQGAHAKASCSQCHVPKKIKRVTAVRYRPLAMACASCHADPHGGQFRGADGSPEDCATCHDTTAFKPARKFVHGPPFTAFVLDGKHKDVGCGKCHQAVAVGAGRAVRRYLGLPATCAGCHEDVHHGEFKEFVR